MNRKDLSDQLQTAVDKSSSGTIERNDLITHSEDNSGREIEVEPFLVTVKRGGGWYVSPTYTAAAWLAEANDLSDGDFDGQLPKDLGAADSPEEAVIGLADTIDELDPETTLKSLPSQEWSALYVYRNAIEDQIDEAQDGSDFTFDLDDQDLKVEDLPGGAKKVIVSSASGSVSTTDADGDTEDLTWELDGLCLTVRHDRGRRDRNCLDDSRDAKRRIREIGIDEPFVVTVKDRGGWVVSPTATLLEYGKEILPKISDAFLYRTASLERVAPVDTAVKIDQTAEVTFNDGGFTNIDVALPKSATVVLAPVGDASAIDDIEVYDPDGSTSRAFFGYSRSETTKAGTYRVVVYGDSGKKASIRISTVTKEELPSSLTVDGRLSDEKPAVDYTFQVPTAGSYDTDLGDSEDVDIELYDERGRSLDCYDSCSLRTGTTYRARVTRYSYGSRAGRSSPFTLTVAIANDPTIDGDSSAYGDTYSGPGTHRLRVPAGSTATVELSGYDDEVNLDLLICSDAGGCQVGASFDSDESIDVVGPFEGTVTVVDGDGSGSGSDYGLDVYDYGD